MSWYSIRRLGNTIEIVNKRVSNRMFLIPVNQISSIVMDELCVHICVNADEFRFKFVENNQVHAFYKELKETVYEQYKGSEECELK